MPQPLEALHAKEARRCRLALAVILLGYFTFFFFLNMLRLWGFGYGTIDLGAFHQVVWNLAENGVPNFTVAYPYHPDANWLGFHFSVLTLMVMTPLYMLFHNLEIFSAVHVLGMTISAIPVYAICTRLTQRPLYGLLWTLIFLLNINQIYSINFSYQEMSLGTPILLTAIWAMLAKRFSLLVLCCAGLLLSKEHFGLVVAGLGLLWGWHHKAWRQGLVLAGAGIVFFAFLILYFMPAISGSENHIMMSKEYFPAEMPFQRYQWFGKPIGEALSTFWEFSTRRLSLEYYALLFLPFLLLPLGGIKWLLPVAADLALIMLSEHPITRHLGLYYPSTIIPAFTIASCATVVCITRWKPSLQRASLGIILVLLVGNATLSFFKPVRQIGQNFGLFASPSMVWSNGEKFQALISFIPQDAALITTEELGSYFADRREIFSLNSGIRPDNTILLRLNPNTFGGVIQPYLTADPALMMQLLEQPFWGIAYWDDPFLVLSPEARGNDAGDRQEILARLKFLYEVHQKMQHLSPQ